MTRYSNPGCALALAALACLPAGAPRAALPSLPQDFPDVLDLHVPVQETSASIPNAFFDQGSWCGYSLNALPEARLGFVGPVMPADGRASTRESVAELEIHDATTHQRLEVTGIHSSALPGRLVQQGKLDNLDIAETLIFADAHQALIRIELGAGAARRITFVVRGGGVGHYEAHGSEVLETKTGTPFQVRTALAGSDATVQIDADGRGYRLVADQPLELSEGARVTMYVAQSCRLGPEPAAVAAPEAAFVANAGRWNGYFQRIFAGNPGLLRQLRYRRVAVKALETLLSNWRAARGDLLHGGVLPSYSNPEYHGFWAWDSWKHALALAQFAPELARDQIRAMFDYQADSGMIPDVIYPDRTENNWRNSKPPLAALAVWEVYRHTHDVGFVREMLPALLRYHRWWYANRDHDGDGLAEYGSTDGTLIAAAWESGMDNAVRFDQTRMVRNGPQAWSMDQASVDLNCFLYIEKERLAALASVSGDRGLAGELRAAAAQLSERLRHRFYDGQGKYFHDITLQGHRYVGGPGPEGWMPLWARVASREQAKGVAALLRDPAKFATYMPFPTIAADDPAFAPRKGYWRGPVWIDQAYFGVRALQNYGYRTTAARLCEQLFENAYGLMEGAPIHENYDPRTGAGLNAPNFSWSAAYFLLLLRDE